MDRTTESGVGCVRGDDGSEAGVDEAALRFLVARAARCDADAWEHLYRRSYPRLFAYARRRVASDATAEDAISETMLRALDRIGEFTWQGGGIDAWLYGILRNVLHESHRRDARVRPAEVLDAPDVDHSDAAVALVEADRRTEVRAAFDRLSPEDRELLELRVVAKLSAEGVAEVMGSTPGAVRTAQSRALHRLRTHYQAVTHEH